MCTLKFRVLAIMLLIIGSVGFSTFPAFTQTEAETKYYDELAFKRGMTIVSAIEHYAFDHQDKEGYPKQMKDLISEKYLTSFPLNVFTGESMKPVNIGQYSPGNFSYTTVKPKNKDYRSGYILIINGSQKDSKSSKTLNFNGKLLYYVFSHKGGVLTKDSTDLLIAESNDQYMKNNALFEDNGRRINHKQEQVIALSKELH